MFKLNVALYFYSLQNAGGAERMFCLLANYLADNNHTVSIISLDSNSSKSYYRLNANIDWHKLRYNNSISGKLNRISRIKSYLKKQKTDCLIGFVMSGDKTIFAAAKFACVKIITAERNSPQMYKLKYSLISRFICMNMLRLANKITVQIPNYRSQYPNYLQNKIDVIENPVSIPARKADPAIPDLENKFTILYTGRLDNVQKRIKLLVLAFKEIMRRNPDWQLKIVGDGLERDELVDIISNNKIHNRVHLIPSTPNIQNYYLNANLFVMPSLWEGFPNSLAEAMAFGLPAIGFKEASGVADLIQLGGGWLAEGSGDVEDLARVMEMAMLNHAERGVRGRRAREHMKVFSPERQLEKWQILLNKLNS